MNRFFFVLLASCIMFTGCKSGNNNSPQVIDSTPIDFDGVVSVVLDDGTRVISVADVENSMSADLFAASFEDSLLAALAPDGQFKSAINTFLLVKGAKVVLIDAGLGYDNGGQLLPILSSLGIKPEFVSAVLLTHLHSDHIGGLIRGGNPVFPKADIYLSVDEFNAWADDGVYAERNGQWKEVLALYANKICPFVDGDTLLDGLAVAKLAVGHTPGHTVYQVGNCIFAGDIIHAQDLQIAHPDFCAKYDGDQPQAIASRKYVLDMAKEKGLIFCGAHCYEPFIK